MTMQNSENVYVGSVINGGNAETVSPGPLATDLIDMRKLRTLLMPQTNHGRRRYTWHSVAAGATVPLCRINIHGIGFQRSGGSQAYSRMKLTLGCWDQGTTMEAVIYKSGTNWHVDVQSLLAGGCGENNYYAVSRGSQFKPNANGWLLMTGGQTDIATINGKHTHQTWNENGTAWAGEPLNWPSQTAWGGNHEHTLSVPYKINKLQNGDECNDAIDRGSSAANPLGIAFYTSNGVLISSPYETQSGDYIELRITNIPQYTDIRSIVHSTIEFDDCNHTVWFYDSERSISSGAAKWETMPVVGVTGASDCEGTDLQGLVFINDHTEAPYGSQYDYIWTEKRGYYNYAKNGDMSFMTLWRMRNNNGKLEMMDYNGNWSTQNFTHVIVGVGTNDAVNIVTKPKGYCTLGTEVPLNAPNPAKQTWEYIRDWPGTVASVVETVDAIVQLIKSCDGNIQITLCLFSQIQDVNASVSDWHVYSVTDGSNKGFCLTPEDWTSVIDVWGQTTDAIFAYAMQNGINVIDWFSLSTQYDFTNNTPGSLMTKANHYNINGWLKIADYADVVRRI